MKQLYGGKPIWCEVKKPKISEREQALLDLVSVKLGDI